jgi:hypothetical protein
MTLRVHVLMLLLPMLTAEPGLEVMPPCLCPCPCPCACPDTCCRGVVMALCAVECGIATASGLSTPLPLAGDQTAAGAAAGGAIAPLTCREGADGNARRRLAAESTTVEDTSAPSPSLS